MSEEKKVVIEQTVNADDYDKAKKSFNDDDYSQEEFNTLAQLYLDSFKDVKEGELVKAKIIQIVGDQVILDVGFKSEGSISKNEFANKDDIKVGDELGYFYFGSTVVMCFEEEQNFVVKENTAVTLGETIIE